MTETKQTYICHICNRRIHTIDGFLGHLKKSHNVNIDDFILTNTKYDLSEAKCPICGKLRRFKSNMVTFSGKTCGRKECVIEHKQSTCFNHFGCKNPSQSKEVQKKREHTSMKKYGVKNAGGSKQAIEKIKQTKLALYGDENYNNMQKHMKTCLEKYGHCYYSQTEESKTHHKQYYLNNFEVEHQSQTKQFWEHYRNTCQKKYHTNHYFQTPQFFKISRKPYTNEKYPDITFGSRWEFKVYDFLKEHDIQFEYQPPISFEYEYDGKIHTYHPDFKIGDKIYEVKGDQFFRINESTGKEEMFLPYRRPEWSDEHYNWMCGLYEAKHQCMLKNNVIILRDMHISNLSTSIFNITTPLTTTHKI